MIASMLPTLPDHNKPGSGSGLSYPHFAKQWDDRRRIMMFRGLQQHVSEVTARRSYAENREDHNPEN